MMRRMRNWLLVCCMICFGMMFLVRTFSVQALAADAGEVRVFDEAQLFSSSEKDSLESQIAKLRETIGMDLVVVTTEDARGMDSETYADQYYEAGGFGVGKNHAGALLLLDMDNRMLQISTEGAMIRYLTDDRIETMLDHAIGDMQSGSYANAVESWLSDVENFYKKGIPGGQYSYDRDTGEIYVYRSIRPWEAVAAFVIAAFCGGAACMKVVHEYGMKDEKTQRYHMAYRANTHFAFQTHNDTRVNQFVTKTRIPRSTPSSARSGSSRGTTRSTTHRSSGGRTHGGGGRKF